ncbi:UNVERIFIED_CONTAM: hypothetical protein Slati_1759200 [Sesamum latifolium]|uniref:Reverse transcriptase domain-containing protein n=1 Tax=Sesamum latifolium TaxID=2727402 RepID=A0AAW2WXZ0_9LAMI
MNRGTGHLRNLVDAGMAEDLLQPYTEEEVTKAIFQMGRSKIPEPDGRQGYMALKLDISKAYDKDHLATLRVSDLIDENTHEWNSEFVSSVLWPEDCIVVFGIPVSRLGYYDTIFYHFSKYGLFTVKSAYHLACSLDNSSSSGYSTDDVKHWWKALCQTKKRIRHTSLFIALIPTGDPYLNPDEATIYAHCHLEAFIRQREHSHCLPPSRVPTHWSHSKTRRIKINFDDAVLDQGQAIGIGVIARSSNEQCCAWISRKLAKVAPPKMIEALATRDAVCRQMNFASN